MGWYNTGPTNINRNRMDLMSKIFIRKIVEKEQRAGRNLDWDPRWDEKSIAAGRSIYADLLDRTI
ncbi:MAG: hypothetical protein KAH32_08010 [Chlamydiia bacterium]|nr:hypothetical protein [Chlamydiia bacterium]